MEAHHPQAPQPQHAAAEVPPTSLVQDPAAYLVKIASQAPSRQAMSQLAGPVAAWFSTQPGTAAPVANLYLQAAAVQLRENVQVGDIEQEMLRTQQQYEILEVCICVCIYLEWILRLRKRTDSAA
jgi:hypothetical protein